MKKIILHFVCYFLVFASTVGFAQTPDTAYIREHYTKYEYRIPMRDGVKLFTSVYVPKDASRKYPFLITRTPYSVAPYGADQYIQRLYYPSRYLWQEGFIMVFQDVRGRYMSEGTFVDVRPHNDNKKGKETDESSDTYDTIEWLLKNVSNNNGKAGVYGISYPGFYSSMAALSRHPALKAVSPQAPVTNWFLGDDFHHNGAFFWMDGFVFYNVFGMPHPGPQTVYQPGIDFKSADNYQFFLKQVGTVKHTNDRYFHGSRTFWNELLSHPNYDAWWKLRDARQYLKNIKAATMVVGGLFDAEDCWGAWETYRSIEKNNPGNYNILVMGPWYHGMWARPDGSYFGDIKFGSNTSDWYQKNVEFPFFMHYLKDTPLPSLPEAYVYDVGKDQWNAFGQWPPADAKPAKLYFREKGQLSFDPPIAKSSYDEYLSDPNKPVPYEDEIHFHRTREYMIGDQRFASQRPDVMVYETQVLDKDLTLAGPLYANLFVATSGTDADYVVKLIDVYPDTLSSYELNGKEVPIGGYQMLVRGEVMRGRYRDSYEKPAAFVPNQPTKVRFYLPDVMHTFRKGHRIMVQVQSSWFPLVDRNPQKFVNIYQAGEDDFQKAIQRLYHQANKASFLEVMRLER